LLEGWDFSHSHPAVLWAQWDAYAESLNILGGVQGFAMYLENFVPKVLEIRYRWFPQCGIPSDALAYLPQFAEAETHGTVDVWSWCDPSGQTNNSGSRVTAVTSLNNFGIYPNSPSNGNAAPERYAAIQAVAGLMLRTARDNGRSFRLNPRCIELRRSKNGTFTETPRDLIVDALGLAYVWDDKAPPDNNPNVRRPKKNHRGDKYSHLMNGLEYIVLGEGLVHRVNEIVRNLAKRRLQSAGAERAHQLRLERGEETLMDAIDRIAEHGRQKDTVEIAHRRMMQGLYGAQPVSRGVGRRGGY
jgi:hypothetical protein